MTFENFQTELRHKLTLGKTMDNPGRGTSAIMAYTSAGNIRYKRNTSLISIPIIEIYNAYREFKGRRCSANDLKEFRPDVFSSKRHGCNCSFFFMVLRAMGLCSEIRRAGNGNSPFCVDIFEPPQPSTE
jgi:hypothetical protein